LVIANNHRDAEGATATGNSQAPRTAWQTKRWKAGDY